MKLKSITVFVVILLAQIFAQERQSYQLFEHKFTETTRSDIGNEYPNSFNKVIVDWVLVDTMENSFGPASSLITPIAYDHFSEALILIHRGANTYAQSSGEIWYNLSTDLGASWNRITSINSALDLSARYPGCAISNPTAGGLSQTKGAFVWTHINNPIFYGAGYGNDDPLGSSSIYANYDMLFLSIPVIWTDGEWTFWAGSTNDGYFTSRTYDFTSIEHFQVLENSISVIGLGGVGYNGTQYLGFIGTFNHPNPGNPIYSDFYPGYTKSTDNGQTWSEVEVVDFRTLPSLSNFDRLFDFVKGDFAISYTGDINVDKDGFVHLIISITDTTVNYNIGNNALVELYETAIGWDGKIIYEGINDNAFTIRAGPAVGQMGPSGYLAFDFAREQMVCVWVADSPTSTLGLCDTYISWRNIFSNEWSEPINLTETNEMNENGAHLAPQLFSGSDNTFKAFVGYFYQLSYFGPDPDINQKTDFWIKSVTFNSTDVKDSESIIHDYLLLQNYPNPFNPRTSIQYAISSSQFVTLKVYDILGNEIATLVSEELPAGEYEVEFSPVFGNYNLVSGIYFYQLKAGSFIQTRKMILMK